LVYYGETVRIQATLIDFDGSAITPDSQTVSLYTPSGVIQGNANTTPTQSATGVYYTDWDIPAAGPSGTWKVVWTSTASSKVSKGIKTFRVEDDV